MRFIKELLFVLSHPSFWLMNNQYNKEWDKYIRNAVKENTIKHKDNYHVTINGREVWATNHPYASFVHPSLGRPSRYTIMLAGKQLEKEIINNLK